VITKLVSSSVFVILHAKKTVKKKNILFIKYFSERKLQLEKSGKRFLKMRFEIHDRHAFFHYKSQVGGGNNKR
jgi:hypothetical protein